MFHGRRPVHSVILQPGFCSRIRQRKIKNQGGPGFYLGPAWNYQKGTMSVLDARVCHVIIMRDVMWLPTVMISELGARPQLLSPWNNGGVRTSAATVITSVPAPVSRGLIKKTLVAKAREGGSSGNCLRISSIRTTSCHVCSHPAPD